MSLWTAASVSPSAAPPSSSVIVYFCNGAQRFLFACKEFASPMQEPHHPGFKRTCGEPHSGVQQQQIDINVPSCKNNIIHNAVDMA